MVASRAQRQTRAARTRRKPQDRRLAPRLGVHWLQFLVGDALTGQGSASRRRSLRADQEAVPEGHHGGGSRLPLLAARQSERARGRQFGNSWPRPNFGRPRPIVLGVSVLLRLDFLGFSRPKRDFSRGYGRSAVRIFFALLSPK